jgi:hypothetical protein
MEGSTPKNKYDVKHQGTSGEDSPSEMYPWIGTWIRFKGWS